jgi:hypothetical protein
MIKALKVTMIVYGVIGILFGLGYIIIPDQMADWFNLDLGPDSTYSILALLGVQNIITAVFIIMAARDPIKNISWVKFAIAWGLLAAVAALYAIIRGYVDFGQIGSAIITHIVFAILLLICYPWKSQASS